MKQKTNRAVPFGPTGKFPDGKMSSDDEGALNLKVGVGRGKVILQFGTPVTWIGLGPTEATALAKLLLQYARKCRKEGVSRG